MKRFRPWAHTLGEPSGVVEASCLQQGYTGDRECSVCGEIVEGEIVAKLEHSYENGACTVCGWREPGLYQGDERLMTWDELVDNGYVVADQEGGRRLKYIADSLYGTLVVAEGVQQVGDSDPFVPAARASWSGSICPQQSPRSARMPSKTAQR